MNSDRGTALRGGADTGGTPVLRQYREAKSQHPEGILLFRLGDFYEIFFEDAVEAAPIMGVALTSRPMGRSGRSPMCGVPFHAWQGYAGKLLRAGRKVVICDQVEAPTGRGIVRREVTRILTPGTVVEDAYLQPGRANYLAATWSRNGEAGLAACDVSTGELLLCQLPLDRLDAEIQRLAPAELLRPPEIDEFRFDPERGRHRLQAALGIASLAAIGAEAAPLAVGAGGVLVEYLQRNQVHVAPGLLLARTYSTDTVMQLDQATVRNLELPGLLRLVDRSITPLGARRLRAWLGGPLREVEAIELRLAAVDELAASAPARDRLAAALKGIGDLERLASRSAQGHASPRELAALHRSLTAIPGVVSALGQPQALVLRAAAAGAQPQPDLADELGRALADDLPATWRDGGVIRPGYDAGLDAIRSASREAREWIAGLEAAERERTGIRGLKVGFNRVFGYYIEVGRSHDSAVPPDYVRKQTLSGAERYITPDLKEREAIVLNAQQDTVSRELEIQGELTRRVAAASAGLLAAAQSLGELDAILALAATAADLGWRRPQVTPGGVLQIRAGRHPLVEQSLPPGTFVPNDLLLDAGAEQVIILTGPNMAGKSTYLRQAALIVLLAQCGSFVPAEAASIGIADRIFTRVGAHDDLAAGMSTFMVEMTETANILNHASRASLVILDEVGRGTSTYDGISIAQAVVEHLHDSPRLGCRTLFATHYHELTALADRLDRVRNQRVEVVEEAGSVRFLHQVVDGGADRSYGIHVAALAGLPPQLIARAKQVLAELERQRPLEPAELQLGLPMEAAPDPVREVLQGLELDRLSPLEALQKLYELRTQFQDR